MLEQARADMSVIAADIARLSPETNKGWGVTIEPLRQALVAPELLNTSVALAGAVGFVLLMACANVANLLLARGVARAREIAVRSSIGGSRGRIVRQLFTESALLAALGGAAGVALAAVILRAAPLVAPKDMFPVWLRLTLDGRVLAIAMISAAVAAVSFGLAPAWQSARVSLADALRSGGRGATAGGGLRAFLAGTEIAAATLLVAGAGLLLRTLVSVDHVDPGCRTDHLITMYVSLPNSRYPRPSDALRFYQAAERELMATPGVLSVGMSNVLPTEGWDIGQGVEIIGQQQVDPAHAPTAHYLMVNSGYFRTFGIPILRGRAFEDHDLASAEPVCIINQEFARLHFPSGDALGALISVTAMDPAGPARLVRRVVGVSAQIKVDGLAEKENLVEVYVPQAQNAWFWSAIAVRTESDPRTFARTVRAAIARVDSQEAVTQVRTMEEVVAETVAPTRFRALLTGAFAVGALALAAIGIFGVLAFSVTQRTREFGIRSALGARSADLRQMVVREALRIASVGIAIGLIAAAVLTRSLASLLFGVKPLDAITFVSAAVLLGLAAVAASAIPAWRAARVDPAVALRQD
jgi:putative ABC transport system permease protein